MKYAIVKVVNGNFFVDSEGYTNTKAAKPRYFDVCKALNNAEDVETACIKIVDENMLCSDGYEEHINNQVNP